MTFDLQAALPVLVPKAIAWAEAQYSSIAQAGQPLNEAQLAIASSVGVLHPELIRIVEVSHVPIPEDPDLRHAAFAMSLLDPGTAGLTLGYGVYVCRGRKDVRLLSHEFRHVQQYEQAGSIAAYLPAYLEQVAAMGYDNAPFEIDARAHEKQHVP